MEEDTFLQPIDEMTEPDRKAFVDDKEKLPPEMWEFCDSLEPERQKAVAMTKQYLKAIYAKAEQQ
ncbi:hypothetical protein ABTD73_19625, partial [Acinetobacter baumannii]